MSKLTTNQVVRQSGATQRQLLYWRDKGVFPAETLYPAAEGSGNPFRWDETVVPRIRLIIKIQNTFQGKLGMEIMKTIYNSYDIGYVQIGDIRISWK